MDRLRSAPDGQQFFDMNGRRIYYLPDRDGVDHQQALDGALLILKEACVYDVDFFSDEVKLRPGDTVLDLGGNLGTSAMAFSQLVGPEGSVFSFEPVFADLLIRNMRANGFDNVEVVPVAVAQEPGEVTFDVTDVGIDSRISSDADGEHAQRFPAMTVDQFVEERGLERVDFIKFDVEGAEEMALRGAEKTIHRFRPKMTIASYHTDPEGDAQHPKLVRLLKQWGLNVRTAGQERIWAWNDAVATLMCAACLA